MGIRSLAAALYEHHHLDPTAKLVLICIADHVNDESGWAWPSVARLAALCNIHPRNIQRWIEHLEQAGHLQVKRRPGWANHYRLTHGAGATGDATTDGAHAVGPTALASKTHGAGATQTKRTRREPATPTPTPPPIAEVIALQEKYR